MKTKNQKEFNQYKQQQYLSTEEAAKFMGIKCSLLNNWRVSGIGPAYVKLGSGGKKSLVRYPLWGSNGLINYMESRIQKSSSDTPAIKHAGKQEKVRYL